MAAALAVFWGVPIALPLPSALRLPLPVAWCLPSLFALRLPLPFALRLPLPCALRLPLPFALRSPLPFASESVQNAAISLRAEKYDFSARIEIRAVRRCHYDDMTI